MVIRPTTTTIRLSEGEKELAQRLGDYLKSKGTIKEADMSSVLRYALRYLAYGVESEIEQRRYGHG